MWMPPEPPSVPDSPHMLLLGTYRAFCDNAEAVINQCPEMSARELLRVLRSRHRDAVKALERLKESP